MNSDSFKSLPKNKLKLSMFYKEVVDAWIEIRNNIYKTKPKTCYDIRQRNYLGKQVY